MVVSKYCRVKLHDTCTGFVDLKETCSCNCHETEKSDSFWRLEWFFRKDILLHSSYNFPMITTLTIVIHVLKQKRKRIFRKSSEIHRRLSLHTQHRIKKKLSQFVNQNHPLIREKLTEFCKLTENINLYHQKTSKIRNES